MQSQSDYPDPDNYSGRELNIVGLDINKDFKKPNNEKGGDGVKDTPPGCLSDASKAEQFPSAATIAGCLDNDPNTPCVNGCSDNDPSTPCLPGCVFNPSNCTLTGDYHDYNMDLVTDPNNIRVKNFMSYTDQCRSEFTAGQVARADTYMAAILQYYYKPSQCGTLDDRVEIVGSNTGFGRASLEITPTSAPTEFTRALTARNGGASEIGNFHGKLTNNTPQPQVKANVKFMGSNSDFGYSSDDWIYGVSTFDLVAMSKHILNQQLLDGYGQLASDINHNGQVTTFDIVELRKLILGIYKTFPAYTQPWRFVPERVTLLENGNLQEDFNNKPDINGMWDNPFNTTVDQVSVIGAPYTEPTFPFNMKTGNGRNGFDAIKIGNANGDYSGLPGVQVDECPGDVAIVMPTGHVNAGETIELQLNGYGVQNIGAFQLGFSVSPADFQFLESSSSILPEISSEPSIGGLSEGNPNLKWFG